MPHSTTLNTWVGLFVATGIAALFFLAMQVSNLGSFIGNNEGFKVHARFENSGGLKVRAAVSVAGVKIGRVSAINFDTQSFESVVELNIDKKFDKQLPDDTSASIFTAGLLGEQYIGLEPGGSEDYLSEGSEIEITQPALILEEIIGQFLFKDTDKNAD